jgi:hypothetical protein
MKASEALLVILIVLLVLVTLGYVMGKCGKKSTPLKDIAVGKLQEKVKEMSMPRVVSRDYKENMGTDYVGQGCSEPLTDNAYELGCYTPASSCDGSYLYSVEAGESPEDDMQQCHQPDCSYDHSEYTAGTVLGPNSAIWYNQQQWLSECYPWSGGNTRLVDDFRPEDYVDWQGIRGPHKGGVSQNNPLFVTEVDSADLTRWRENDRRCNGIFDFSG